MSPFRSPLAPAETGSTAQEAAKGQLSDVSPEPSCPQNPQNPPEANILLQWADEYNVPSRGPEVHPGRPMGQEAHIHIGNVNHIPVRPD